MRAIHTGIERDARLARATQAWLRVSTFRGERVPCGLTGRELIHHYAWLIVELGTVLREDGWQERVDHVSSGTPDKTFAVALLKKAIEGDLDTVERMVGESISTLFCLGLSADGWLRDGLRFEVLDIPPEPEWRYLHERLGEEAGTPGSETSATDPSVSERNNSEPPEPEEFAKTGHPVWRRVKKTWRLTFAGKTIKRKDGVGLRRIARLIAISPREIHVAELVATGAGRPIPKLSIGTEILDKEAYEDLRKRYDDLADQLVEARRNNDPAFQEKLQKDMGALNTELRRATGLGGRRRRLGNDVEKARKQVQMSISRTIDSIANVHPELARHLRNSIHLGQNLSYQPEKSLDWQL
jgi:hypothetical protein